MADHEQLETEARGGSDSVPQDPDGVSEILDDDKLPADFPPDEPMGSFDYGVTPQEQRVPEPVEERDARYRPETSTVGQTDTVGPLVAPDQGTGVDDERALVADEVGGVADHDRPLGDVGTGDTTVSETATELTRDVSAEEDAVRERRG